MFARLNFLFSVSLLTVFVFYLVGRYVLLRVAAALLPGLLPWLTAAYILASLMLTVLILARTVGRMDTAVAKAAREKPDARLIAAQILLLAGHLACLGVVATLFPEAAPVFAAGWTTILPPVLYIAGLWLSVTAWKRRAAGATA